MVTLRVHDGTPEIVLEPMTANDARVLGEAFAAIEPWSRYPLPASALEVYLGTIEPAAPRYAIRVSGALAGATGERDAWLRGPYLQFLGILPAFQCLGIGRLVLTRFEAEARARDQRNLWVAASDFNSGAIRFYERHGFERIATLDGLIKDPISEILMRKKLCDKI